MLAALSLSLCSCEKDEADNDERLSVITKLYQVKMRRELMLPCHAYVMQLDGRDYFYMLRLRFNQDLKVGDAISFSVFSFCPDEISKINGCELGDGTDAGENEGSGGLGYLVVSDPIEENIKNIFSMRVRYSIAFLPTDSWFIETTDGNLLFVKKNKVNVPLAPGDRIVYSKYTLYDEIFMLKKL